MIFLSLGTNELTSSLILPVCGLVYLIMCLMCACEVIAYQEQSFWIAPREFFYLRLGI